MKILLINGANLNMLGKRNKDHYGSMTLEDINNLIMENNAFDYEFFQSNWEGAIIDRIQKMDYDGLIINAGAYTHTSIALQDAIRAVTTPVIEVHISNVHKREEFRHKSMISCACVGVICGFGLHSYRLAVEALLLK